MNVKRALKLFVALIKKNVLKLKAESTPSVVTSIPRKNSSEKLTPFWTDLAWKRATWKSNVEPYRTKSKPRDYSKKKPKDNDNCNWKSRTEFMNALSAPSVPPANTKDRNSKTPRKLWTLFSMLRAEKHSMKRTELTDTLLTLWLLRESNVRNLLKLKSGRTNTLALNVRNPLKSKLLEASADRKSKHLNWCMKPILLHRIDIMQLF